MERRMVRICSAGDQLPDLVRCSQRVLAMIKLTLKDIEANAAQPVDVGVVDLSEEADLGRSHGVVVGQEEFKLEYAACICQSAAPKCLMRLDLPSYGDCEGPSMVTSKYRRLSSWGVAEMPCTLWRANISPGALEFISRRLTARSSDARSP